MPNAYCLYGLLGLPLFLIFPLIIIIITTCDIDTDGHHFEHGNADIVVTLLTILLRFFYLPALTSPLLHEAKQKRKIEKKLLYFDTQVSKVIIKPKLPHTVAVCSKNSLKAG